MLLIIIFCLLLNYVSSHVSFYPNNLQYSTSSIRVSLKITHGCDNNSTNKLEATFPSNFVVKPEFKQGWTTIKNSNIITWSSDNTYNNVPYNVNDLFWIWITIPKNFNIDYKYYSPTIQSCYPSGLYEWTSVTSTGEPAPYYTVSIPAIVSSNNEEQQSNNTNNNLSEMNKFLIVIAIISIISLLMNLFNEYRYYKNNNKKYNHNETNDTNHSPNNEKPEFTLLNQNSKASSDNESIELDKL
jgi:uncharacterized protein YcnI